MKQLHEELLDEEAKNRFNQIIEDRLVPLQKQLNEAQQKLEEAHKKFNGMSADKEHPKDKVQWHKKLEDAAEGFIASKRPLTEFWRVGMSGKSYFSLLAIPSEVIDSKYAPRKRPEVRLVFTVPPNLIPETLTLLDDRKMFVTYYDVALHPEVRVEKGDFDKFMLDPLTARVKNGEYSIIEVLDGLNKFLADKTFAFTDESTGGLLTGDNFRAWYEIKYTSIKAKIAAKARENKMMRDLTDAQLKKGELARRGNLIGAELMGAGVI